MSTAARAASPRPVEPPTGFEVDHDATRLYNENATFVLTDHTLSLLATKEGDMFLYADPEGNLRGGELPISWTAASRSPRKR
ncbi:MAG: hypothetical protein E6G04_00020 [Actinobacteria bacterium]|nr:MAG: hypothetical protein E6G04_00020 [Actinomycetota bacterium]